jgi:inorganic pyrophosphatase/exopolyphosphatase
MPNKIQEVDFKGCENMVKKREILKFDPNERDQLLRKDGKTYRLLKTTVENGHVKDVIFEEIDEPEYEAMLDKIATYLVDKSHIDAKTIITDVLRQSDTSFLNKLIIEVDKGSQVDIVPGCLSLKIGKKKIDIVE